MKIICLLLLIVQILPAKAQAPSDNTKIGYADVEYIFSQLPAAKQIESELKSLQTQLESRIKAQYEILQKMNKEYVETEKTLENTIRLNKQKELQQFQGNFQKLQLESEDAFKKKQQQLMNPVTDSIQKAIEGVAKEKGFALILNAGVGQQVLVLHADKPLDISDLVLQKLGVTPKPEIKK